MQKTVAAVVSQACFALGVQSSVGILVIGHSPRPWLLLDLTSFLCGLYLDIIITSTKKVHSGFGEGGGMKLGSAMEE